jgi:1,6-anhydro-N-acetylmuramate kinase
MGYGRTGAASELSMPALVAAFKALNAALPRPKAKAVARSRSRDWKVTAWGAPTAPAIVQPVDPFTPMAEGR